MSVICTIALYTLNVHSHFRQCDHCVAPIGMSMCSFILTASRPLLLLLLLYSAYHYCRLVLHPSYAASCSSVCDAAGMCNSLRAY
jgi:hypothetical protein